MYRYLFPLLGIYGTERRGSDKVALPVCVHKSLTNETSINVYVNVLCHGYLHNRNIELHAV